MLGMVETGLLLFWMQLFFSVIFEKYCFDSAQTRSWKKL